MKKMYSGLLTTALVILIALLQFCDKAEIADMSSETQTFKEVFKVQPKISETENYVKAFPATKSSHLNVITNGGFESGFAGWTISATGYGIDGDLSKAWIVGATDPNATNFIVYYGNMPHSEPLAHSGTAGASAVENGSTHHLLYQDVTLPNGIVELNYWIRWKSQAIWHAPNEQNIQVNLRDISSNTLIANLFDASALDAPLFSGGGDFNTANYEKHTFNISSYAGQSLRLEFRIDVQNYFMYVDLDDIEIIQLSYPAEIMIKPSGENEIDLRSKGKIPVALLSDPSFDVTEMDLSTITLGNDDGNDTPIFQKNNGTYQASFEDVNEDGMLDLIMQFSTEELISNGDLDENTTMLKFNGVTYTGQHIIGEDVVLIL